jgi:hypothetical protein
MMMSLLITKNVTIYEKIWITTTMVDVEWYLVATSVTTDVVGDGLVVVIVMPKLRVVKDDGETTPRVEMTMLLSRTEVITNRTIGAVVKGIEPEETFANTDAAVDGAGVVVATTDMKADQVGGKGPVMVDFIVVVTEVVSVEDVKNFVVVHTEVVITKVVEVDTVAEAEVVTSYNKNKLTKQ